MDLEGASRSVQGNTGTEGCQDDHEGDKSELVRNEGGGLGRDDSDDRNISEYMTPGKAGRIYDARNVDPYREVEMRDRDELQGDTFEDDLKDNLDQYKVYEIPEERKIRDSQAKQDSSENSHHQHSEVTFNRDSAK
mmetsp:Transcript_11497/g.11454  ORF Transcript_11497/g.11454 Transcript_11497/m.11454 type:complete len:136 (-) Transcript_11497:1202-1609(-)|eukprot:CAMPEP_0197001576 /NCGR_PEP_ID=MMETSP1380-20130617/6239_1 /TAXON_ID=5936 /ORGANISM="Euplotes crassus, Strain CT5" /LENGTH=135 /DNA_ID=CAMNT_0042419291 /DNA_START=109 /DNA_END=516 /DNA_ORIENTATION=-